MTSSYIRSANAGSVTAVAAATPSAASTLSGAATVSSVPSSSSSAVPDHAPSQTPTNTSANTRYPTQTSPTIPTCNLRLIAYGPSISPTNIRKWQHSMAGQLDPHRRHGGPGGHHRGDIPSAKNLPSEPLSFIRTTAFSAEGREILHAALLDGTAGRSASLRKWTAAAGRDSEILDFVPLPRVGTKLPFTNSTAMCGVAAPVPGVGGVGIGAGFGGGGAGAAGAGAGAADWDGGGAAQGDLLAHLDDAAAAFIPGFGDAIDLDGFGAVGPPPVVFPDQGGQFWPAFDGDDTLEDDDEEDV